MAGNRSLGVLTLDLVAKVGGFVSGMNQAERAASKSLQRIEKQAQAFGRFLGTTLGVSLAGSLTAGVVAIDKAIDRIDQLRDLSIRLGIGVETLSAFGYAAQQTGTDVEGLAKGLKILAKNAADAVKPGSTKGSIFESIGVAVQDAEGNLRSLDQLIPDIADAFAQLEDGTQKAALAQELFGKSGLDLIEFLNQGGAGIKELTDRARELGIVIDQDAADKADAFKDTLAELQAAVLGLATQVAVELLPDLIALTKQVVEWTKEGSVAATVADELSSVFSGLAETASFLWNVFDTGAMTLKGVAYDLAAVYKLAEAGNKLRFFDLSGAKESFQQAGEFRREAASASQQIEAGWSEFERKYGEGAKAAQAAVDKFKVNIPGVAGAGSDWRIPGLQDSFSAVPVGSKAKPGGVDVEALRRALAGITNPSGGGGKGGGGGKSEATKALEEMQRAAERARESVVDLNASYDEQIALFGETSEAAKLRYQFEHEDISKLDAETQKFVQTQRDLAIANAERLDALREEAEVQERLDAADKRRVEAAAQVLDDIKSQQEQLGMTAEAQDTYNKLLYAGVDANSALGQSIIAANHELHEQAKATALQIDLMDVVRDGTKDLLGDLVDAARSGADAWDILKDAIDEVAASLTKMILNNLVEKALGEGGSTSGGSAGGWLAKIAGWFFGSGAAGTSAAASGGSFVGPRAIGGPVFPGVLWPVNEHQPELLSTGGKHFLMMGSQQGQVTPLRENGGARIGGRSITVINQFPPGTGQRTIKQASRDTGRAAAHEMSRTD